MVKSNKIYSVQEYLLEVTGKCYIPHGDDDVGFISSVLDENDMCLWDYPLNEIDHIVEEKIDVVLVDCMVYNGESLAYEHEYRWFEII